MTRQVNIKDTSFLSEEAGDIITDTRKFGVELEVISKSDDAIEELSESIADCFGFHHDGSVREEGSIGLEVVTPPMSGKAGEEELLSLLEKMNKLKFKTNLTCGLHVHHDANAFLPSKNIKVTNSLGSEKITIGMQGKLYNILKKNGLTDKQILNIGELSKKSVRKMEDGSRINARKIILNDKTIYFYAWDGYPFYDTKYYFVTDKTTAFRAFTREGVGIVTSPDDVGLHIDKGNPQTIKSIMYLYTAFTDVFLSMMPNDRRENGRFSANGRDYCKKLIDRISPFDVERCNTVEDLEKIWLKGATPSEIKYKKNDKYDESRYYGVNFHSLFAKFGTIEVRWHEGTLNPQVILYWIALHQHMIRKIEEGAVDVRTMKSVLKIYDLNDKVDYFFSIFGFPKYLEKYMRHRIEFFTNINKKQ